MCMTQNHKWNILKLRIHFGNNLETTEKKKTEKQSKSILLKLEHSLLQYTHITHMQHINYYAKLSTNMAKYIFINKCVNLNEWRKNKIINFI